MTQIVCLSGGKDSTAMLHAMLERGETVDGVIFYDTGWEHPQAVEHVAEVGRRTGLEITTLRPVRPWMYWLAEREVVARKGAKKGQVHRIGYGWPSHDRRWCTRLKMDAINAQLAQCISPVVCIGYAADEPQRAEGANCARDDIVRRYPLIEYGMDSVDAMRFCTRLGYTWGGLYEIFERIGCYCCPLHRIGEFRRLRRHCPEQWAETLRMDAMLPEAERKYAALDERFAAEDARVFALQQTARRGNG